MSLSSSPLISKSAATNHRGIYLVPFARKTDQRTSGSNFIYRIVAVGAALFLAATVC